MRKWRPSFKSIYIIPEVRGNIEGLEIILNRILPLRKFVGQEDILIVMGGLIDGDEDGGKVIETLMTVRKEYGGRFICIRGDHEEMLLRAVEGSERDYQYWIEQGGATTLSGYLKASGVRSEASSLPQNRLRDIIPESHIAFLKSLDFSYELDDYLFVHGGINPKVLLSENNPITFAFDTVANRLYKAAWKEGGELFVEKCVVATHNSGREPVIYPRYFALGGTAPQKLLVGDLSSMEFCAVKKGKSRIYKTKVKVFV